MEIEEQNLEKQKFGIFTASKQRKRLHSAYLTPGKMKAKTIFNKLYSFWNYPSVIFGFGPQIINNVRFTYSIMTKL